MQVQWKASFIVAALALSFATVFQNVSQSYKNLSCAERVAVHHRGLRDLLARPPKSKNIWLIFSHLFRVNTLDTTVVILNWSRFPNVINITSVLCHPELADIIAEIFIWNNSPNSISLTVSGRQDEGGCLLIFIQRGLQSNGLPESKDPNT
jgi:hypothetical protein